jgi:hypothetical protein
MKIGHFTLPPMSLPFPFHIVVVLLINIKDELFMELILLQEMLQSK